MSEPNKIEPQLWLQLRGCLMENLMDKPFVQPFSFSYTEKDIRITTLNYEYNFRVNKKSQIIDVLIINRSSKQSYPVVIYDPQQTIKLLFDNSRILHRLMGKIYNFCSGEFSNCKCRLGDYLYIGNAAEITHSVHLCVYANGELNLKITTLDLSNTITTDVVNVSDLDKTNVPETWKEVLTDLFGTKPRTSLSETELEVLQGKARLNDVPNELEEPHD